MNKAVRLRCEYVHNPVGVQTRAPRFSRELRSEERGRRQAAYRIFVSESEESTLAGIGDWWDSGRVESAETFHIAYAGRPLVSGQRCYWTVRCWDRDGRLYEADAAASFDMGILRPEEWTAQWIGAAAHSAKDSEPFSRFQRAVLSKFRIM